MIIRINIEKTYLMIFFGLLLWLSLGNLWDNQIEHPFPYGHLASDAFQHQVRTEGLRDLGNYRYEADYAVSGYSDIVGYYPPILFHDGVILSYLSLSQTWDSVQFIVFLSGILTSFMIYLIIRRYNKQIALLSLPLHIFIFIGAAYTGFTWGHWPAIFAQLFLASLIFIIINYDIKNLYVLLGILVSSIFLSHTSELLFGLVFLGISVITLFIKNKLNLKEWIKGGILSIILSLYYAIIFVQSWMPVQAKRQLGIIDSWGAPTVFLESFFMLKWLIILGIILVIFSFINIKKFKNKMSVMSFLILFVLGYSNYFGFGMRAFQLRFLWAIYLSVFMGFALLFIIKLIRIPKNLRQIAIILVSVILILFISKTYFQPINGPGIMNEYQWEILNWVEENTAKDESTFFFYSDYNNPDANLRNTKRTTGLKKLYSRHYSEVLNKITNNIKENQLNEIAITGDTGAGMPSWESELKIKLKYPEEYNQRINETYSKLCSYDYFVFYKYASVDIMVPYNNMMKKWFLENNMTIIKETELATIVKNDKPKGDCLNEL